MKSLVSSPSRWPAALAAGAVFAFAALPLRSAMTVDSLSGPVTANEISSFITFMQAQTPADNNYDNLLAHHQGGENLEALGAMYEATGNQQILDLMITFADHALHGRNDPSTGLVNWDGSRELTWPIGANSDGTEVATTEGENGDVIAHIAYCAQLILETPAIANQATASDPYGYGSTYAQRAATYVTQCDRTEDTYLFRWFLNASNQWYTPTDSRYAPGVNWEHNHPFPWNQQMMLNGGLERLATCHAILNDNPSKVSTYTNIIQTSVTAFLAAMQNGTSGSDPVYVWSYFADPANVFYSTEDNTAHSAYDLMGAFRAYESGLFGITKSAMTPFANTLTDVISLGSNQFSGLVDGTSNTSHPVVSTLWSEWLYTSEFRTDAYTILANADLSKASSKADYFARIMWMKNRRYQAFGLAPSPASASVAAGGTATAVMSVSPLGALGGTLALSASGLPSGVSASFSPASINTATLNGVAGSSTLTITTTAGAAPGTYSLTLTGNNGTATHSLAFPLTVTGATGGQVNDNASGVTYAGTWTYSSARGLGDYQDDVHYTKTNGDSVSYTFTGTGIDYVTETNTDEGNVAIYIDGVLKSTVSCNSATRQVQHVVYSATGLSSGSHTFKAVKSSGTYMLIDELIVHAATILNDNGAGITYTGTWTDSTARGLGDYQDDVHYTKTNGDSVSCAFTGTGIDYVTETNTNEGNVAIYIDGVLQTTVSCVSTSRQVQQTVYSATGLSAGAHTFKAVKSSGTYLLVDEFIVH